MRPPPGYPFVGPLQSRPPPAPGEGAGDEDDERSSDEGNESPGSKLVLAGFLFAFATLMTGVGFLLVALLFAQARAAAVAAQPSVMALEPGSNMSSRVVDSPGALSPSEPPVPPVARAAREVPTHPDRFLEGCSEADLAQIDEALGAAIAAGTPLFNDGDVEACADTYESGSRKLEAALPLACRGAKEALAKGRAKAASLEPAGKAWALRDAFDGLLEVIERSRSSGVGNL